MNDDLRQAPAEELRAPDDRNGSELPRSVQIDLGDLERLVRRAYDETHVSNGGGRGALEWETQQRLAKMLDNFERTQRLRERLDNPRREVHEELSRLRAALVARRGFAEDLERATTWPVDPERWHTLRLRTQARLLDALPQLSNAAAARVNNGPSARIVAAELLELFAKERAASLAEHSRRSDVEGARLERRLAQLLTTLEDADLMLAGVRDAEHAENGFASGYREVQGLEAQARFREQKAEMLELIFRANLDLQQPIRARSG